MAVTTKAMPAIYKRIIIAWLGGRRLGGSVTNMAPEMMEASRHLFLQNLGQKAHFFRILLANRGYHPSAM
jgi:hypothetical protein